MRRKTRECSILVTVLAKRNGDIVLAQDFADLSSVSFCHPGIYHTFQKQVFYSFLLKLPKTSSQPTHLRGRVAKKGRKLNNKSRLSGFAVVNYHLQPGEKKRLIGVCTVCVSTLSCPASCLAWNSLYAWSERTRPNMAEQRAELISFTPASTLQFGDGGGGGVGDGLGLPPRPCLRISQI